VQERRKKKREAKAALKELAAAMSAEGLPVPVFDETFDEFTGA
jgi:hypothetical protein